MRPNVGLAAAGPICLLGRDKRMYASCGAMGKTRDTSTRDTSAPTCSSTRNGIGHVSGGRRLRHLWPGEEDVRHSERRVGEERPGELSERTLAHGSSG